MFRFFERRGDIALALGVVLAVAMLVLPLPTLLVDLLLTTSIAISVTLLLAATYVRAPLSLTALPAILLLATLFRLALNVSTTRLILLQADAGRVIESFGAFVVQGNYVVGGVVFVILTVIQFVVIAKGAERVAEVSARFTLDALPGRQLAIDADLRSGAIDLDEAQRRRSELQREARLYGALDGAMKFVKGDAIAGLVITAVNIAAGLSIGILQQGLPAGEAARIYTLLTIGDGLVTQIPAILVATTAGVVVTQVPSDRPGSHLASDIGRQILAYPKAVAITAALLLVFALLPGLPFVPFALLAVLMGLVAWRAVQFQRAESDAPTKTARPRIELALGAAHWAIVESNPEWLPTVRRDLWDRYGVDLPTVELKPLGSASSNRRYRFDLDGIPISDGEVEANALASRLETALEPHLSDLLGVQTIARRVQELTREAPDLVDAVTPQRLSLPALARLLGGLVDEGVSVRDLRLIFEIVARQPDDLPPAAELLERVRQGLKRQLTHRVARQSDILEAYLVDRPVEDMIRSALKATRDGTVLSLDPDITDDILDAIERVTRPTVEAGRSPVLLTHADVRAHLRRLAGVRLPRITVLSYEEISPSVRIESAGRVAVGRGK